MLEESEWEDADLAVEEDLGTSDRGLNTNTKQYIKKKNIETKIRIVVQEIDFTAPVTRHLACPTCLTMSLLAASLGVARSC